MSFVKFIAKETYSSRGQRILNMALNTERLSLLQEKRHRTKQWLSVSFNNILASMSLIYYTYTVDDCALWLFISSSHPIVLNLPVFTTQCYAKSSVCPSVCLVCLSWC